MRKFRTFVVLMITVLALGAFVSIGNSAGPTLHLGLNDSPDTLDVWTWTGTGRNITWNVYEPLVDVVLSENGVLEKKPRLAHSWTVSDDGKIEQAKKFFEQYLPALVLKELMGVAFCKEIMKRRGIFKNNRIRIQQNPFDKDDMREIDRLWQRISPI